MRLLTALLVGGLAAGCVLPRDVPRSTDGSSLQPTPTKKIPVLPTPAPTAAEGGDAPLITPTIPKSAAAQNRTKYKLTARLDPKARTLDVAQAIDYQNQSGTALETILLLVEPNRLRGAFRLQALRVDGVEISHPALDGARLWIRPAEPLAAGANLRIEMDYRLTLPDAGGPFGATARQLNFADWYAYIPPVLPGAVWMAHEPTGVGEHLAYDLADFEVDISLPEENVDWKLAASASGKKTSPSAYHYEVSAARNFTWSISPLYVILERNEGGVRLNAAVFPANQAAGKAALTAMTQALRLFTERFGAYPHASLTVVDADFFDGMEYDGLFFLDTSYFVQYDGTPQNYLVTLSAHETAHQWWYGLVANDPVHEPWLDESLCTYSELLFYEEFYPGETTWWWGFRIGRFHPQGWVNGSIEEFNSFRPYVDAVYLRGALFLQALRGQMGDKEFNAFLKEYAARYRQSRATSKDFFALLPNYISPPDDLIAQYFKAE